MTRDRRKRDGGASWLSDAIETIAVIIFSNGRKNQSQFDKDIKFYVTILFLHQFTFQFVDIYHGVDSQFGLVGRVRVDLDLY